MKKVLAIFILSIIFIPFHAYSQVYSWERIYDGIINGDTVCNAYAGGFSFQDSRPSMYDLDGDGDLDFFLNMDGNIAYLRNDGTSDNPCWNLATDDFIPSLTQLGILSPTFADINGDSLPDLLTGDYFDGGNYGTVHYYKNISTVDSFLFVLENDTLANLDVWDDSDPVLGDVDLDGDVDLIVGGGLGDVYFCRNVDNDQWSIPVKIFENSGDEDDKASPALGDIIGNDGIPELLIGSASDNIKLFKVSFFSPDTVIWELVNPDYLIADSFGYQIPYVTFFTTPILAKLDNDSLLDLLLVSHEGEFIFHKNIGTIDTAVWAPGKKYFPDFNFFPYVNSSIEDLNNDGQNELITPHTFNNYFTIYSNQSSNSFANWVTYNTQLSDSLLTFPTDIPGFNFNMNDYMFVNYDQDNLKDLIVRNILNPTLAYYKNVSSIDDIHFNYVQDTLLENIFSEGSAAYISAGDLDNDNMTDLLMYDFSTQQKLRFEIVLTPEPHVELITSNFEPGIYGIPTIYDFDFDGKTDIVTHNGSLYFYKNIGSNDNPVYALQSPFANYGPPGVEEGWKIKFADIDGVCGNDIYTSTPHGILLWGFRGIKPAITSMGLTSFEICDSTNITLTATPSGGNWSGDIAPDGTFVPAEFSEPGDYWMIYTYTDPGGCFTNLDSQLISITECVVSSTALFPENRLTIVPNPATETISINYVLDIPAFIDISIGDIIGTQRMNLYNGFSDVNNNIIWSIPLSFNPGIYLITLSTDFQSITKKVIIR